MKRLLIFTSVFVSVMLILSLIFRISATNSLGVSFFKFESISGLLWFIIMVAGFVLDIVLILLTCRALFHT